MQQNQTVKKRLGMLEELGLPIVLFIARHTKLTIYALRFLILFLGNTKRSGKVPFAVRGKFSFDIDKYNIKLWVNQIGVSDESRWLLIINSQSRPFSVAYKGAFA